MKLNSLLRHAGTQRIQNGPLDIQIALSTLKGQKPLSLRLNIHLLGSPQFRIQGLILLLSHLVIRPETFLQSLQRSIQLALQFRPARQ